MENKPIVVGYSDYPLKQIESDNCGCTIGNHLEMKETLALYKELGFRIEFKTSLFRRIFCLGKYKIIAHATT